MAVRSPRSSRRMIYWIRVFEVPVQTIRELLSKAPSPPECRSVLSETGPDNPLSLEKAALVINSLKADGTLLDALVSRAREVKEHTYGDSVKLFVPVYISNVCENECLYCSYRASHQAMVRRTLSVEEFRREVARVTGMGYRVVEIVTSESKALKSRFALPSYVRAAREILDSASQAGQRPEVILMSWALSEEELSQVRDAGCDAFYLWQETYDEAVYRALHPRGTPKADFAWRIGVFDRAVRSGISRVGIGVLFGLAPWEFDVLALISHGKYIENTLGGSLDVIGIPRFKPAAGAPLCTAPHPVGDDVLRAAVALYRLSFPRSHVFLNTREKLSLLMELLAGGGSEMNIACSVFPGGYTERTEHRQFEYYSYPTDKTLDLLAQKGYRPTHFVMRT